MIGIRGRLGMGRGLIGRGVLGRCVLGRCVFRLVMGVGGDDAARKAGRGAEDQG